MFVLRSAFWLCLAMVVLVPLDWDEGVDVSTAGQQVLNSGKQVVAQKVNSIQCTNFECAGGKAMLIASGIANNPLLASPMQDSKAQPHPPVPRPRLNRAG